MSQSETYNYSQVVCECPHAHLLGTIMATESGIYWCAERPLTNNKSRIDGQPMTRGQKVKADCAGCRKDGRFSADYQASWKRVAEKLAEARDTRAERVTLVFG
jgi:hypothetical protein